MSAKVSEPRPSSHKKFVVFGSCLSGQTGAKLKERDHQFLGSLNHVRSDVLLNALLGKEGFTLTKNNVDNLAEYIKGKNEKQIKALSDRIQQNTKDSLKCFLKSLREAEFIVFDNQYDLECECGVVDFEGLTHVVSNVNVNHFDLPSRRLGGLLSDKRIGNYNELNRAFKK